MRAGFSVLFIRSQGHDCWPSRTTGLMAGMGPDNMCCAGAVSFIEGASHVLTSLALRREQALALPQLFTHEHSSSTRRRLALVKDH